MSLEHPTCTNNFAAGSRPNHKTFAAVVSFEMLRLADMVIYLEPYIIQNIEVIIYTILNIGF